MRKSYCYSTSEIKAKDLAGCLCKINKQIRPNERILSVRQLLCMADYSLFEVIWEHPQPPDATTP